MADKKNHDDLRAFIEKLREVRGDVVGQIVYVDEDPSTPEVPEDHDHTLDWIIEELEHKSEEE
jgi:hypothetical protein